MSARVLVAMSGGVDSSVAAALLVEQGYEVVGVAMRLTPEAPPSSFPLLTPEASPSRSPLMPSETSLSLAPRLTPVASPSSSPRVMPEASPSSAPRLMPEAPPSSAPRRGTCCSYEDFEDARRVAERMDFPFYVVDLRADFAARVIGNFVSEYLSGRTPNPCVMCNREIKFDRLWSRARALEADFVATGHYAQIECDADGRFHLRRAHDRSKDQSYFLFTLGQSELARTLFPLGAMTKTEVRERARALGLANADKPDSQEICFVLNSDYASFVERAAAPGKIRRGSIVTAEGHELAEHSGVHNFTVGQRRGLGIAAGMPMYVSEIRAATGEVVVGSRGQLNSAGLIAGQVRMVDSRRFEREDLALEVKIRYRHPALPAKLRMLPGERAEIRFDHGGPAVTPGQACVFYRGDEVLGGGFIERAVEG